MPNRTTPGIYVEIKDVSGSSQLMANIVGKQHLYLVYQRADGTRQVIRGGAKYDLVGPLDLEIDQPQADSLDKNTNGEERPSVKLDIDPAKLDQTWAQMASDAKEIHDASLVYDSWPPFENDPELNSNSVVRRLIEKQGFDPVKSLPPGVAPKDVPGYENNLEGELINRARRQEIIDQNLPPAARRKALRDLKRPDRDMPVTPHKKGPVESHDDGADNHQDDALVTPSDADTTPKSENDKVSQPAEMKFMPQDAADPPYPDDADAVRNALMPADTESGDDFETLLLKTPDIMTEEEATQLGHHAFALKSNDPRKKAAEDLRRDFYDLVYSTEAVEYDATGRMIAPTPKTEIPADPQPAKTSSGEELKTALGRVAAGVADAAAKNGKAPAVMALQTGLSLLGERLKIDGDPGPKTRGALTRSVAKRGADKAQDAFALGQVQQYAKAERNGGSASGLKDTVEKSVQPLFGGGAPKVAAATLQESLNDLQNKRMANRVDPDAVAMPLLKIDGDIGPKTTDAFRLALAHDGPERLTKTYGRNLGFGLDSDIS